MPHIPALTCLINILLFFLKKNEINLNIFDFPPSKEYLTLRLFPSFLFGALPMTVCSVTAFNAISASIVSSKPAMAAVISRCGIKDNATIEDLIQDATIKAWQNVDKFEGKSKVSSWLCSIAKNTAIDHLRKHGRMVMMGDKRFPEKVDTSLHVNPEAAMIADEAEQAMNDKVQTAISKLNDKHAQVITMYHLQDMSYEAIAKQLRIPKGSVMSRLFHARKKMRELLKHS